MAVSVQQIRCLAGLLAARQVVVYHQWHSLVPQNLSIAPVYLWRAVTGAWPPASIWAARCQAAQSQQLCSCP